MTKMTRLKQSLIIDLGISIHHSIMMMVRMKNRITSRVLTKNVLLVHAQSVQLSRSKVQKLRHVIGSLLLNGQNVDTMMKKRQEGKDKARAGVVTIWAMTQIKQNIGNSLLASKKPPHWKPKRQQKRKFLD